MSGRDWRAWRRIGVVGAGNMGSGIAQKYAAEGYPVVLVDLDDEALARGLRRARETLGEAVERKIHSRDEADGILARMTFTTDLDRLRDADLVIEAVFEDLGVKRALFERLGGLTGPGTALASNTSSFAIKDLAGAAAHPERVLGLHYFYHPAKNRLVEVVAGPQTLPEILEGVWDLQEAVGKTPIASTDSPGFIVNRFFVPWINEAARILDEGIGDVATIEQAAIEGFRIGMGPFQLMNVTGIPIGYHAAASLQRQLGDFYKPARSIKDRMERGAGFETAGEPDRSRFEEISGRLLGLTFHICSELVSEGVGSLEDTDLGARVGLRWAQGPFQMMNRLGIEKAAELAGRFQRRYGLKMPPVLIRRRESGKPFDLKVVRREDRDGLAHLTFYRPDAMNALNEEVLDQFEAAFDAAAADPAVRGVVLKGSGKAFVAGADVRFFVKALEASDFDRIRAFTHKGHRILEKVDRCPKPVIVQLDGVALGGGFELALAADRIVATEKGSVGFPETGIGIYPGLGGTQRTSRRIGAALTRYAVLTGQILGARQAAEIGLVDEVVDRSRLEDSFRRWAGKGPVGDEARGPARRLDASNLPAPWPAVAAAFERLDLEAALSGKETAERSAAGGEARSAVEKALKSLPRKAPVALRIADRLIRDGAGVALEEGLRSEIAALEEIFATRDAYEGLKALTEGRRPEYKGK
jgi:enoyl-CoA hydratase/3-hydroxyacyl-CoA dehydrogenase